MTLRAAIAAFIASDCDRTKMNVPAWAATYRCDCDAIRAEWEAQMTIKSQQPNNVGEIPEGK